jgi:predicted secreted Zn-dependent protease
MAIQLSISRPSVQIRPALWAFIVVTTLSLAVYTPIAVRSAHLSLPTSLPIDTATTASSPSTATATPQPSAAGVAAAPQIASVTSPVAACTPIGFPAPSEVDLSNQANGLTAIQEQPTTYQIYGQNAGQLRSQIQACAPGAHGSTSAEFTAETSYRLTWQYSITNLSTSCNVTSVKVGLRTATTLPYWQPTSAATQGLGGRWNSFITALATHEQGHANLDRQYAASLVNDLAAIQNTDCSTINTLINAVISQDVNALNTANDAYDNSTNHGATQGAVLPTY